MVRRWSRSNKYGSIKTDVDGIVFDSKKEARRYQELLLLEKAGQIRELLLQVRFPIAFNGVHICEYVADFTYYETRDGGRTWEPVIEDVKGWLTQVYRLKRKLVHAAYGMIIRET